MFDLLWWGKLIVIFVVLIHLSAVCYALIEWIKSRPTAEDPKPRGKLIPPQVGSGTAEPEKKSGEPFKRGDDPRKWMVMNPETGRMERSEERPTVLSGVRHRISFEDLNGPGRVKFDMMAKPPELPADLIMRGTGRFSILPEGIEIHPEVSASMERAEAKAPRRWIPLAGVPKAVYDIRAEELRDPAEMTLEVCADVLRCLIEDLSDSDFHLDPLTRSETVAAVESVRVALVGIDYQRRKEEEAPVELTGAGQRELDHLDMEKVRAAGRIGTKEIWDQVIG